MNSLCEVQGAYERRRTYLDYSVPGAHKVLWTATPRAERPNIIQPPGAVPASEIPNVSPNLANMHAI